MITVLVVSAALIQIYGNAAGTLGAPTAERAPLVSAMGSIDRVCFPTKRPAAYNYTARTYRKCVRPRARRMFAKFAPDAWPIVDQEIDRIVLLYKQSEAGQVTRDSIGAAVQSADETTRQQLERLALTKAKRVPANARDAARQRAEVRYLLEYDAWTAAREGHRGKATAALETQRLRCNWIGPDWYCASYTGPADRVLYTAPD